MALSDLKVELKLEMGAFERGLHRAASALRSFTGEGITGLAGLSTNGVGVLTSTLGGVVGVAKNVAIAFAGVGAGAAAAMGVATKVAGDFEQSLSNLQAVSLATDAEMVKLKETAVEMGAKTSFSASQAADAMYYLSSAGFSVQENIDTLPALLNLAAASATDLATTANITANVMAGFGLKAKDAANMADILALTAADANTDVVQLGDAFKYVGPVAAALGFSIEETAASIGILSNAGLDGGKAGTTLRMVLARLAGPTQEAARLMKDLGIELYDASGAMKPLPELVDVFNTALGDMADAQKVAALGTIVGTEAATGFISLLNAGGDTVQEFTTKLENAGGTADRMAAIQLDNLKGSMEELSGAIETAAIKLGDRLIPLIRPLIDGFRDLIANGTDPLFDAFDTLAFVWEQTEKPSRVAATAISLVLNAFGFDTATIVDVRDKIASFFEPLDGFKKLAEDFFKALGSSWFIFKETGNAASAAEVGIRAMLNAFGFNRDEVDNTIAKIKEFVNTAKEKLGELKAFFDRNKDNILGFLGGAAIAAGLAKVILLLAAFANPVTGLIVLAGLLGMAWQNNLGGIRDKTSKALEAIREGFTKLRGWYESEYLPWAQSVNETQIAPAGDRMAERFSRMRSALEDFMGWYEGTFAPWFQKAMHYEIADLNDYGLEKNYSSIRTTMQGFLDWMDNEYLPGERERANQLGESFSSIGDKISESLRGGFARVSQSYRDWYQNEYLPIVSEFGTNPAEANMVESSVNNIIYGLTNARNELTQFITDVKATFAQFHAEQSTELNNFVTNVKVKFEELRVSLSESWNTLWGNITTATTQWHAELGALIAGFNTRIRAEWRKFLTAIYDNTVTRLEELRGAIGSKMEQMRQGIASALEKIKTLFQNTVAAIEGAFNKNWASIGASIINGIIAGLEGSIGRLIAAAQNLARAAYDAIMSGLDAHSPSKLFEYVGRDVLGEGFAKGIDSSVMRVSDATASLVSAAYDAANSVSGSNSLSVSHNGNGRAQTVTSPTININVARLESQNDLERTARLIYQEMERLMI